MFVFLWLFDDMINKSPCETGTVKTGRLLFMSDYVRFSWFPLKLKSLNLLGNSRCSFLRSPEKSREIELKLQISETIFNFKYDKSTFWLFPWFPLKLELPRILGNSRALLSMSPENFREIGFKLPHLH